MWAYKSEDPITVLHFHVTTHDKLWKVLFKPQKEWPAKEEDIGLDAAHPPKNVMKSYYLMFRYSSFNKRSDFSFPFLAGLA